MNLDAYLASRGDRCPGCGYHPAHQGCVCETDEWALFTAALRQAARGNKVRQRHVRPLIHGRIEPKHIGLLYRRARREGLLREVDREESNDVKGGNTNKWEPVYELRSAA